MFDLAELERAHEIVGAAVPPAAASAVTGKTEAMSSAESRPPPFKRSPLRSGPNVMPPCLTLLRLSTVRSVT